MNKKILSLDYGRKNIGISLSDTTQSIAFLYEPIQNNSKAPQKIKDIIENEQVGEILIGKNQTPNPHFDLTEEATQFIKQIDPSIKITVINEDFSTFEAINKLKKLGMKDEEITKMKDSAAAQIMLEKYLQSIE